MPVQELVLTTKSVERSLLLGVEEERTHMGFINGLGNNTKTKRYSEEGGLDQPYADLAISRRFNRKRSVRR